MKNWKILVLVFVFGIAFFGCNVSGKTTVNNQSSNNEQQLIGTWTNINDNSTIVFNSNGTMTWDNTYTYGAAANKLVYYLPNNSKAYTTNAIEFYISTDGKILIIIDKDKDGYAFRKNS